MEIDERKKRRKRRMKNFERARLLLSKQRYLYAKETKQKNHEEITLLIIPKKTTEYNHYHQRNQRYQDTKTINLPAYP